MRRLIVAVFSGFLLLSPPVSFCAAECMGSAPLKSIHRVCGIVINPLGEAISGATITILKDGQRLVTSQTEEDGKFSFEQLKAGHYEILVEAHGFKAAYSLVEIIKPSDRCKRAIQVVMQIVECSGMGEIKAKDIR